MELLQHAFRLFHLLWVRPSQVIFLCALCGAVKAVPGSRLGFALGREVSEEDSSSARRVSQHTWCREMLQPAAALWRNPSRCSSVASACSEPPGNPAAAPG